MSLKPVEVSVLGAPRITVLGVEVSQNATHLFAAVLALALVPSGRILRKQLASLLWSGAPPSRQSERLRWLLSKLRRLGVPLHATVDEVGIPQDQMFLDCRRPGLLTEDFGPDGLDRINAILESYAGGFSQPFAKWIELRRDELVDELLARLSQLLLAAKRSRNMQRLETIARAMLRVSPWHEEGILALAEALSARGERARAMDLLDEYLMELGDARGELRLPAEVFLRRLRPSPGNEVKAIESRLVGRTAHFRRFDALLADVLDCKGRACLVAGPPGVGKTRLLDEFCRQAVLADVAVTRGRCQVGDTRRPLAGLVDIVPQLLSLRGAAGCDPALMVRLTVLESVRGGSRNEPLPRHGSEEQEWLGSAIVELLRAIAEEQPLFIALDDIQWSHEAQRALLGEIMSLCRSSPILWCFAARANDTDSVLALFPCAARSRLTIDWLGPLESPDAKAMMTDQLRSGARPASDEIVTALVRRAGGVPFVVEELARHWQRTGDLIATPHIVGEMVADRVLGLPTGASRALQIAGMLGAHSTLERLERILQLPRPEFIEAIAHLERAGILQSDSRGATFGHVLWAEAALSQIEPSLGRILHRHVAEDLSRDSTSQETLRQLWDAARHWELSDSPEKALTTLLRVADHLALSRLFADAAEVYGSAVNLATAPRVRLQYLARQIELLRLSGRWSEMLAAIEDHERLAVSQDSSYDRHNRFELWAHAAQFEVRRLSAKEIIRQALNCARDADATSNHRIRACFNCIREYDAGLDEQLREAHSIALSLMPTDAEGAWYQANCDFGYNFALGDVRRAASVSGAMLAMDLTTYDPYYLSWTQRNIAIALHMTGEATAAREQAQESMRIAREAGLPLMAAMAFILMIVFAVEEGDIRRMRQLLVDLETKDGDLLAIESLSRSLPYLCARLALAEGSPLGIRKAIGARPVGPMRNVDNLATPYLLAADLLDAKSSLSTIEAHASSLRALLARRLPFADDDTAVYAHYLERFHGRAASDEFVVEFMSSRRVAIGRPSALLRPFVARLGGRWVALAEGAVTEKVYGVDRS